MGRYVKGSARGYLFVGVDVDDDFAEDERRVPGRRLRQAGPLLLVADASVALGVEEVEARRVDH
jgi:hypothetical protein